MKWIFPLFILIFFEFIADVLAKSWSLNSKIIFAVGSLLAYLLANTFWLFALKNGAGLGRGAVIFSVASALIAITLGFFIYHETVSKFQVVGIILGLTSLIFIFWE